jgi:hypothetical protein
MTKDDFEISDNRADIAIKLFNDYYAGKVCYLDTHRIKKGIILGLNKHLLYKINDEISPNYYDRNLISINIIEKAKNVVYTVGYKLEHSTIQRLISFDLFMKANNLPKPIQTRRPYNKYKVA